MIALALSGAVWTVALLVLALCVALRACYVLGQREQARRAATATTGAAQTASYRAGVRAAMRHDPARAARLDAVDPL